MLRPRFFTASLPEASTELTLEKEPSRHIARALRMRAGDSLCLFDGSGRECAAQITRIERDAVSVLGNEINLIDRESPLEITLAIALARGDRIDVTVQKATELGVRNIWPFTSERTGVRLDAERMAKKLAHWQRIAISACEQCGRNRVPEIATCTDVNAVLERSVALDPQLRLILHPSAGKQELPVACRSLLLLIGPEGGFGESELQRAQAAGFAPLLLGPRVLRTETAPLAAVAMAQARWGDLLPV